ncbi:MAG: dTDP-4-amino-4,6-dideoxy-D-galactose acyltransferase [Blastocatellia bacterium]|nr:dTDP-4-amino-4,6-dideoxy-D-galactose acyltransferase [Blastocatellia bacterium]
MLRPYRKSDLTEVESLFEGWEFKPFSGHDRWPAGRVASLCKFRVGELLDAPSSTSWVIESDDKITGFTSLSILPWDSAQIGMSAARIDYLLAVDSIESRFFSMQSLMDEGARYCIGKGIEHLSIRVDAADVTALHVLENAGFVTVDGLLTFASNLKHLPVAMTDIHITIRLGTPDDAERAADLASCAYSYDRFHSDPAISTVRANELHATWLKNSCAGLASDAVVIAEDSSGLLGFVTCKLQRDTETHLGKLVGTIVLVATSESARGKGVGRAMTLAAIDWFRGQGVEIVEVGTQLRNIPASRLYQSCGFQLVGSSISLRALLPRPVLQRRALWVDSESVPTTTDFTRLPFPHANPEQKWRQ